MREDGRRKTHQQKGQHYAYYKEQGDEKCAATESPDTSASASLGVFSQAT